MTDDTESRDGTDGRRGTGNGRQGRGADPAPGGIREVPGFDLEPGEYTVVPSDWRRDAGEQMRNVTSGSEDDGRMSHLHDVERADGTRVLEVVDDRRGMDGSLDTSGQQLLFRTPDGEPVMAFQRDGGLTGSGSLRAVATDEVLASWEQSIPFVGSWKVFDGEGRRRATANREWSPKALMYPAHTVTTPDGGQAGRFALEQSGAFYNVGITVEPSAFPPEVLVALAYAVSWSVGEL